MSKFAAYVTSTAFHLSLSKPMILNLEFIQWCTNHPDEYGGYPSSLDRWGNASTVNALIERGLTKEDCKALVERAGIKLPAMYLLGYDNANCIGCVKGGHGYFRAVREDFPVQFERLAQAEDKVAALHGENAYILRHRSGPLAGQRFPLRELPAGPAHRGEPLPNCGLFCESAEQEYSA